MAAKRTPKTPTLTGPKWLALADTKDPQHLPTLLETLEDTSVPQLEHRFLALALWPPTRAIGEAAASFFQRFPVRFREQLGAGCAALGALVMHGAAPGFAAKRKKVDAPNDVIPAWRDLVLDAAAALLEAKQTAPRFSTGPAGPALPKSPRAALQAAWLERAGLRREADLPELLLTLPDGPATDVTARLGALVAWPRSAAIADAAAKLVDRPLVGFNAAAAIFPLTAIVLAAHGDASHATAARRLGSEVTSLSWLELAMSTEARAPAAAKPQQRRGPDSELDFLRWMAEAPDDLTRRHAFADWLLERGLPRGEFMSLQLAALERPLTPKEQKRVKALESKHQREWLRPFWKSKQKDSIRFRGGVLTAIDLTTWGPAANIPPPDEPQLATLEHLWIDGGRDDALAALLRSPLLRSVRDLAVPGVSLDLVPPALAAQLTSLGVHLRWGIDAWGPRASLEKLDALSFPQVKTLHLLGQVRHDTAPLLGRSRLVKSLDRLVVQSIEPLSFWAFARESSLRSLIVSPELGVFGERHGQLVWRFSRAEGGWSLEVTGADVHDSIREAQRAILLDTLPALEPSLRARTTVSLADPTGALPPRLRELGVAPAGP